VATTGRNGNLDNRDESEVGSNRRLAAVERMVGRAMIVGNLHGQWRWVRLKDATELWHSFTWLKGWEVLPVELIKVGRYLQM
jgi:hypothetical protein